MKTIDTVVFFSRCFLLYAACKCLQCLQPVLQLLKFFAALFGKHFPIEVADRSSPPSRASRGPPQECDFAHWEVMLRMSSRRLAAAFGSRRACVRSAEKMGTEWYRSSLYRIPLFLLGHRVIVPFFYRVLWRMLVCCLDTRTILDSGQWLRSKTHATMKTWLDPFG